MKRYNGKMKRVQINAICTKLRVQIEWHHDGGWCLCWQRNDGLVDVSSKSNWHARRWKTESQAARALQDEYLPQNSLEKLTQR